MQVIYAPILEQFSRHENVYMSNLSKILIYSVRQHTIQHIYSIAQIAPLCHSGAPRIDDIHHGGVQIW
jgi:hypothetical protein